MKAFLMAAGLGSRLRPITNTLPKCLVQINDVPLIDYWLRLFIAHGIDEILINTHYLHKKISEYFQRNNYDLSVSLLYEEKLLGSLGTLIQNKDKFIEDSQILVCYSDNLTDIDLTKLVNYHTSHDGDATIGLFQSQNPSQCGIVELDYDDTVIGFEEKPDMPKGNLANAGIYVFNTSIFNDIEQYNININEEGVDIGNNLLPKLVGRMKGYMVPEYLIDIGSLQNYQQAIEYMTSRKSNFFNNIQFDKMR